MNLWRLEWLRLVRTPRALSLAAVYLVFGLAEPVLTKYESKLIPAISHGVRILRFPPVTPAAGLSAYVGQVSTVGLIVVVVIAAGALTFDAHQGLAIFLRTRVSGLWQLIAPRFTVNAGAAAVGYALGTVAAWYETELLIGHLPAPQLLAGLGYGAAYLAFAVAVSCAAASFVRGTLGAVGLTLVGLIGLSVAGAFRSVHDWLPSALVGAPSDLLTGTSLAHYLPALAITAAVTAALLALAVRRLRAREI